MGRTNVLRRIMWARREEVMRSSRSEARLDRAMRLFWERGYYDTSVDELIRRTGLHRAALYGQFGSKRGLFKAALARYLETITPVLFAPLRTRGAALGEIEQFFRGIHRVAALPEKRLGCLMVNTASEVSPHIPSVARIVSRWLDELRALLRRACINARKRGEVRTGIDADQVADYLAGATLGLWALARSPVPRAGIVHYLTGVVQFLSSLRPREGGGKRSEIATRTNGM